MAFVKGLSQLMAFVKGLTARISDVLLLICFYRAWYFQMEVVEEALALNEYELLGWLLQVMISFQSYNDFYS